MPLRGPYPRIRKTIKWGGAVLTALMFAAWITSVWRSFGVNTPAGGGINVRFGLLFFDGPVFGPPRYPGYSDNHFDFDWWRENPAYPFQWRMYQGTSQSPGGPVYHDLGLPLWWFWSSALLITAPAWCFDILARRRERKGKCAACDYDRTGLSHETKCSECGSMPS